MYILPLAFTSLLRKFLLHLLHIFLFSILLLLLFLRHFIFPLPLLLFSSFTFFCYFFFCPRPPLPHLHFFYPAFLSLFSFYEWLNPSIGFLFFSFGPFLFLSTSFYRNYTMYLIISFNCDYSFNSLSRFFFLMTRLSQLLLSLLICCFFLSLSVPILLLLPSPLSSFKFSLSNLYTALPPP